MNKTINLTENGLVDSLIRESLNIANGFHEEVYYNKSTNEITFSGQMTSNSWNETEDSDNDIYVGTIESFDFSDFEGWKAIDDFVEVDDDCNETDMNFKNKDYERYYENSSIITIDEAISRLDIDEFYGDVVEKIEEINPNYWR